VLIGDGRAQALSLRRRAGELRTGRRHRQAADARPFLRRRPAAWRNTSSPLAHSPADLIASIETGCLQVSDGCGKRRPTGQFNFAVEEGLLIENGDLGKAVKEPP